MVHGGEEHVTFVLTNLWGHEQSPLMHKLSLDFNTLSYL